MYRAQAFHVLVVALWTLSQCWTWSSCDPLSVTWLLLSLLPSLIPSGITHHLDKFVASLSKLNLFSINDILFYCNGHHLHGLILFHIIVILLFCRKQDRTLDTVLYLITYLTPGKEKEKASGGLLMLYIHSSSFSVFHITVHCIHNYSISPFPITECHQLLWCGMQHRS